MFYAPSNYRRDRCNVPAENGDYTIEIPSLEFGEESYASLNIVGRQLHDDEGLHFGNIELVGRTESIMQKRKTSLLWTK